MAGATDTSLTGALTRAGMPFFAATELAAAIAATVVGGVTSWSALNDKVTAPVATDNTSVANALLTKASLPQNSLTPASSTLAPTVDAVNTGLANKGDVLAPVTLTGVTTLTRALHGNRQLIYSGAAANITVGTDAGSLWLTDDAVELHTATASAGNPTVLFPDGKSIVGSPTKIIGGTRKGADSWTAGTTDPTPPGGVQTGIQKPWAASGAAVTAPADLLDNVLVAIALPALGPNAMITFEYLMSGTGIGNKTRRVSLSTTAAVGTTMYGLVLANPLVIGKAIIRNRNNSANQIGNSGNISNDDGYGSAAAAGAFYSATATFDTAVAGKFLVFSVTKATAADAVVLEHYCLSIFDPTAV